MSNYPKNGVIVRHPKNPKWADTVPDSFPDLAQAAGFGAVCGGVVGFFVSLPITAAFISGDIENGPIVSAYTFLFVLIPALIGVLIATMPSTIMPKIYPSRIYDHPDQAEAVRTFEKMTPATQQLARPAYRAVESLRLEELGETRYNNTLATALDVWNNTRREIRRIEIAEAQHYVNPELESAQDTLASLRTLRESLHELES